MSVAPALRPEFELDASELAAAQVRQGSSDRAGALWAALCFLEHVLAVGAVLDPRTGDARPSGLLEALAAVSRAVGDGRWPFPRDGVVRQLTVALDAFERVIESPRSRGRRVHARVEPAKVREQDVRSLIWLARQPGRTLHEKSATARRIQAVVREPTWDLLENRVARRVFDDLEHEVRRRLLNLRQFTSGAGYEALLQRFLGLARRIPGSHLAEVSPSLLPQPNNVLLSDPDYAKIWRTHRLLVARVEAATRALEDRDARLTNALALASAALIASRSDVFFEQLPLHIRLSEGPAVDVPVARFLSLPLGGATRLGTVSIGRKGLRLALTDLRGGGLMEQGATREVSLSARFIDGPVEAGRGHRAVLVIREDGTDLEDSFCVDAEGMRDALQQIEGWMLGDRTSSPAARCRPPEAAPFAAAGGHAGWSLASPFLHTADDAIRGGLLAGRVTTDNTVFEGPRALPIDGTNLRSSEQFLELLAGHGDPALREEARQVVAAALARAGGHAAPGDWIGVAVPDQIDELGGTVVRACVPLTAGRALLVPHSIAAVMAAPAGTVDELAPGTMIAVVDLASPVADVSVLRLSLDENASPGTDARVWDRLPALEPVVQAAEAGSRGWHRVQARIAVSAAIPEFPAEQRDAVSRYLADSGLLEVFRGEEIVAPVMMQDALRILRLQLPSVPGADAREAWLSTFDDWLTKAVVRARGQHEGRSLGCVLVVGAPEEDVELVWQLRVRIGEAFAAPVQLIGGGAGALARGAKETVRRHALKLPTWRDTLPPLFLKVQMSTGVEWVPILPEKRFRPGDAVELVSEKQYLLPKGKTVILFPLSRSGAKRERADFKARLTDSVFPLSQDVRVRFEVRFRYATDAFSVRVLPVGPAPFDVLKFEWAGEGGAENGLRSNSPPQLPEPKPWEPSALAIETLGELVSDLEQAAKDAFKGNPIADIRNSGKCAEFLRRIDAVQAILDRCRDPVAQLWTPTRTTDEPPPPLRASLARFRDLIGDFAGLRGGRRYGKGELWRRPEVERPMRKLRDTALQLIARLRSAAGPEVAEMVLARLRGMPEQRWFEAMERQLGSATPENARAAAEFLGGRLTLSTWQRPTEGKLPLKTLATGVWTGDALLHALTPDLTRQLIDSCEIALRRVTGTWSGEDVAGDLAAEAMQLLLGLLRLRPNETDPRLTAGTNESEALVELVEQAGRAQSNARAMRKPRLRLNSGSELSESVAEWVRGHDAALVIGVEE